MTFMLHQGGAMIGSTGALIKAANVGHFVDAQALLNEAHRIRADAIEAADQIRADAHARGMAEAQEEAGRALDRALATQAAAIEAELTRQRADIAALAYAGATAIIGALGDGDVAPRLAARAVAQIPAEQTLTLRVAPARADAVRQAVGTREGVVVEGDAAMGPFACTVVTRSGRVVADLDVQLGSLAKRWSVDIAPEAGR